MAVTLGCHCMLAFTFWEPFVAMVSFIFPLFERFVLGEGGGNFTLQTYKLGTIFFSILKI